MQKIPTKPRTRYCRIGLDGVLYESQSGTVAKLSVFLIHIARLFFNTPTHNLGGLMRQYNLTVLIDVNKGEDFAKEYVTKLSDLIKTNKGTVYSSELVGRIDLAVTFKKHSQAYQIDVTYSADPKTLEKIQKEFKINEAVIRNINVLLESIKSEEEIATITG